MNDCMRLALAWLAAVLIAASAMLISYSLARAHDDGQFAADPILHAWFDHLASGRGLCCSFADGVSVSDVDWDTGGDRTDGNSGYRVRLDGQWINVPDAAVVTEPNKFEPAVVWPFKAIDGSTQIRCFLAGAGT